MAPPSPTSPRASRKPIAQSVEETGQASPTDQHSQSPDTRSKSKSKSNIIPRRPLPQPLETSSTHSKKLGRDDASHEDSGNVMPITSHALDPPSPTQMQKPRRFAPQMIETSRRRRKSTDTAPCLTPSDKTDVSPGDQDHLPKHLRPIPFPIPPANSPVVSSDHVPQVPQSKFSSSKLAEKQQRRHSFRVPDLPAIPSQSGTESNDSSLPSLSTSPSAGSDETEQGTKKERNHRVRRESHDTQWSGYLLSLAAKTAEKQLREQAMAAYPNEHAHEPVDHYAIDRDSEEAEVDVGVGKLQVDGTADEEVADRSPAGHHRHRESAGGFELAHMRKHQEKLDQERRDQWAVDPSNWGRRKSTRTALQEAQNVHNIAKAAGPPSKNIVGWQKDDEMKPMQKAASPPMAGQNLKFPKSQSPRATQLDVHQYPGAKKHDDNAESRQHTGLWTPQGGVSRANSDSGLWHGVCNIANQETLDLPKTIQTGLLTPVTDRSDPFSSSGDYGQIQLPPSPPSSQGTSSNLDIMLRREQTIENEFNDIFVTQVYNYLSLGYPSLARKFDIELSKITQIPVDDLRKDDEKCNAKGYVGAPEGTGVDVRGVMEGDQRCERWCALKIYVREWGRQQPGMCGAEESDGGGWGARARKGSWAI